MSNQRIHLCRAASRRAAFGGVTRRLAIAAALGALLTAVSADVLRGQDAPDPEEATFRILGLFMKVRVEAFEKAAAAIDDLQVVRVDYDAGEATLRLSGPLRLQKGDRDRQLRALNERVRIGTRGAFELAAPQAKLLSKRTKVEIAIKGHDCLGCSFGAYRAIYQLKGVYRVTADFGEGQVIAWIDPQVTDRDTLQAELEKKKVVLRGDD